MKNEIGIFETKTHLSEIINKVVSGEEFTITKRGVAVAKIIPIVEAKQEMTPEEWITKCDEFAKRTSKSLTTQEEIKEMINRGRKY